MDDTRATQVVSVLQQIVAELKQLNVFLKSITRALSNQGQQLRHDQPDQKEQHP